MSSQDPFQRFSFETAGHIMHYLDPQTVIRSERVSKGWRDFIRAWIVSSGFSNSFHERLKNTTREPVKRVRKFKELAAVEANLEYGKPTSVRKIEARDGLLVAGNYAAWRSGGDFHWQRLDFKEDGSLFPVQKLHCEPLAHRCRSFLLNAYGYLVIERRELLPSYPNMSIDVYSIEEDRKLYTLNEPDGLDPRITGVPLALGARWIYFRLRNAIQAYDLLTGAQLYTAQFAGNSHSSPGRPFAIYWDHYTRDFALLHDGEQDLLPVLWNRVVHIIKGEDGTLVQEITVDSWRFPYIVVAPSQKEFAVVSVRNEPKIAMEMRMQRFSRGQDGLFAESLQSTEHVFLDFRYTGHNIVAMDPFRHLVAIPSVARGIPEISRLVSGNFKSVFIPDDPNDIRAIEALCRDTVSEITLPPKYAHHKKRRPIVPNDKYRESEMRFVDGDRLLYRTTHCGRKPDAYYLFDFRLRTRGNSTPLSK